MKTSTEETRNPWKLTAYDSFRCQNNRTKITAQAKDHKQRRPVRVDEADREATKQRREPTGEIEPEEFWKVTAKE